MTVSKPKTPKSPTLKRHLADVKYFAPLQILCGGADIINKDFIGVELDEKYYKIAEERISSAIKQTT